MSRGGEIHIVEKQAILPEVSVDVYLEKLLRDEIITVNGPEVCWGKESPGDPYAQSMHSVLTHLRRIHAFFLVGFDPIVFTGESREIVPDSANGCIESVPEANMYAGVQELLCLAYRQCGVREALQEQFDGETNIFVAGLAAMSGGAGFVSTLKKLFDPRHAELHIRDISNRSLSLLEAYMELSDFDNIALSTRQSDFRDPLAFNDIGCLFDVVFIDTLACYLSDDELPRAIGVLRGLVRPGGHILLRTLGQICSEVPRAERLVADQGLRDPNEHDFLFRKWLWESLGVSVDFDDIVNARLTAFPPMKLTRLGIENNERVLECMHDVELLHTEYMTPRTLLAPKRFFVFSVLEAQ